MGNCLDLSNSQSRQNVGIVTDQKDVVTVQKDIVTDQKDVATFQKDVVTVQKDIVTDQKDVATLQKDDIYSECTDENTFYFNYEKIKKKVKILRIIDGDTVDIAMSLLESESVKDNIYKYRVRLYGIDTPEKRPPKNDPNRDKEIAASKRSSEALNNYLRKNNYIIIAQFYKPDKYGRLLATFYDKNGDDINKWMVSIGYAYEYFGNLILSVNFIYITPLRFKRRLFL
jgi:endonuclease YncB( thermonuclease family)